LSLPVVCRPNLQDPKGSNKKVIIDPAPHPDHS
jgi:hypothetical protein